MLVLSTPPSPRGWIAASVPVFVFYMPTRTLVFPYGLLFYPDDGGSFFYRKICTYLASCTIAYSKIPLCTFYYNDTNKEGDVDFDTGGEIKYSQTISKEGTTFVAEI
jgi:hypothetical protein